MTTPAQPPHGAGPTRVGQLLSLSAIALQLATLALVIRRLHIESAAFYDWIVPLAFGGWLVHHVLPLRWRLHAFVGLSLAAISLVFRQEAVWIVGAGLVLILLARAPVRAGIRVAMILGVGVLLAAWRTEWLSGPIPVAVWPILGSMFMFRLIAYLYDVSHAKAPPTWPQSLAYFFCLPNVAFPLFPVVDFSTFCRTYYDRPAFAIYQQGVAWMARGVVHLVLYRLVYQYGVMSPSDVVSLSDLVRYILANFALYLRVSGQFHLIVGMLHLYGFRLPETHRFFWLAGSFTDFWRRINIYWKDFMQKVVFNPTYFPLRKRWGDSTALVLATLSVFGATWFFHSYQWFWLLGTWLWSLTDTLFWAILAMLLVINVLRESRQGRARSLGAPERTWRAAVVVAARSAATFAVLAFLWTLWTSPTIAQFISLVTVDRIDAAGVMIAVAILTGIGVAAVLTTPWASRTTAAARSWTVWQPAAMIAVLVLIWAAGSARVTQHLPVSARTVLRDVRLAELNRQDADQLQRGYYENIVGVNRFNTRLWEVYAHRARSMPSLRDLGILRDTNDESQTELVPLAGGVYNGAPLRINSWGMRDREYAALPAPATFRISLLGQSYVMGMGVGDGETFETLIEDRLNATSKASNGTRFEILNFAVPRYSLMQQLRSLTQGRVLSSGAGAVVVVGHTVDYERIVGYVDTELARGASIPAGPLRSAVDSSGITKETPFEEKMQRLQPYSASVVKWALQKMGAEIRDRGALPIYAFIPMPLDKPDSALVDQLLTSARNAGFRIIDLRDVFADRDAREVIVAEFDRHPNAEGHRMIAARLYEPLVAALRQPPITVGDDTSR